MAEHDPNHPQGDDRKQHAQPQQPGQPPQAPRNPEQREEQPRQASANDEPEGWIPD